MEVKVFTKILKSKQGFWPGTESLSDCGLEAEINLWLASQSLRQINAIYYPL